MSGEIMLDYLTIRFSWSRKASTSWRMLCCQSGMSCHRQNSINKAVPNFTKTYETAGGRHLAHIV